MSTENNVVMTEDQLQAPVPLPEDSSTSSNLMELANTLEKGVDTINDVAQAINDNKEPINAGINLVKMIADSAANGTTIDNNAVVDILETIAKFTSNDLDDKIVGTVKAALNFKF